MNATARDDAVIEQAIIDEARRNPVVFNDYVLRDEKTNAPTTSCKMHREWHKLIDKHPRLQILSHIDSGKTSALGVGRVLWELGRNPDLRVVICADTQRQAEKIVGLIGRYVESSSELHRVFPHLQRDPQGKWNQSALSVVRSGPSKDASVQACGVHGNILGARVDLLILDDIVDFENSRVAGRRDDLDRWLRSTLLGRLTEDARVWVFGNPWARQDQYARFEQSGFRTLRYPVVTIFGRPRWPEKWTAATIAEKRATLGPREAARQLDLVIPDDANPIYLPEWVDHALKSGENASTEIYASARQPGDIVVLGVDCAYSQKERADLSALVLVRAARGGRREVTMVQTGRWTLDELVSRIVERCKISRAVAAVEVNAGGEFVAQGVEKAVTTVRLHTSASSKLSRQQLLESELAQGRWSFRQPGFLDPAMAKLAQGLLAYSPNEHCPDEVAALFVAVEAIRQREQKPRGRMFDLDLMSR